MHKNSYFDKYCTEQLLVATGRMCRTDRHFQLNPYFSIDLKPKYLERDFTPCVSSLPTMQCSQSVPSLASASPFVFIYGLAVKQKEEMGHDIPI